MGREGKPSNLEVFDGSMMFFIVDGGCLDSPCMSVPADRFAGTTAFGRNDLFTPPLLLSFESAAVVCFKGFSDAAVYACSTECWRLSLKQEKAYR